LSNDELNRIAIDKINKKKASGGLLAQAHFWHWVEFQ
jgi:hypothetical protein